MAASKKKKVASHSDFAKTKTSIKSKQRAAPSNATNTSFKARSIVLPNQGTITQIEERKQTQTTDNKGRGVSELINIVRGVGQGTSKSDALDSLASLLPKLSEPVTTALALLPVVLPLITSNSAAVRTALIKLSKGIFSLTNAKTLAPYGTTITLWVTSGMNHIWKEVREDAAKLAEVVLEQMGPELIPGWTLSGSIVVATDNAAGQEQSNGHRIFATLLTALGIGLNASSPAGPSSGSTMSVQSDLSSSPLSKLRLLHCLDKLLQCQSGLVGIGTDDQDASKTDFPLWIFRTSFNSAQDWDTFQRDDTMVCRKHIDGIGRREEIAPFTSIEGLAGVDGDSSFADVVSSAGRVLEQGDLHQVLVEITRSADMEHAKASLRSESHRASKNPYLQLYSALHPLLLHTFLDHAPTALGPEAVFRDGEPPMGLRLIDAVLCLTRTLGRAAVRRDNESQTISGVEKDALRKLNVLLDHTALYFPYEAKLRGQESYHLRVMLKRMSASWCELVGVGRMLEGVDSAAASSMLAGDHRKGKRAANVQRGNKVVIVEQYLLELLSTSSRTTDLNVVVSDPLSPSQPHLLSDSEHLALLPTMWYLLSETSSLTTTATTETMSPGALLSAFITHWSTSKPSSATRHQGLLFLLAICSLVNYSSLLLELRRRLTRPSSDVRKALRKDFICAKLGRTMFEMGTVCASSKGSSASHLQLIELCLALLLDLCRYDAGLMDAADWPALWSTLKPFFWVDTKGRNVAGPFTKLAAQPSGARVVALARAVKSYILLDDSDESGQGTDRSARELIGAMSKAGL